MFKVVVPATSANMGPGFDSLGIALGLYNNYYFEEIEEGLVFEGCPDEFKNENNLVYISMKKCFERTGYQYKGIKIVFDTKIPVSRGLGSSAACAVAGALAANKISGNVLSVEEILKLTTEIEGHPDNVAPALFGGMIASAQNKEEVLYSKAKIDESFNFYILIPDFKLSTQKAREVLPKKIDYSDGIFNVGRTALMLCALSNGDGHLLKASFQDKLHQPYRGKLIEGYDLFMKTLNDLDNTAGFISGAGSTLAVITKENDEKVVEKLKFIINNLNNKWIIKKVDIDYEGAKIIN